MMSKKQKMIYIDEEILPDVSRLSELTGLKDSGVFEMAVRILATYPDKFVLMELLAHAPKDYRKKGNR